MNLDFKQINVNVCDVVDTFPAASGLVKLTSDVAAANQFDSEIHSENQMLASVNQFICA